MKRFCPTPELNASPRINTTRRTSTPGDRLKAKVTQVAWGGYEELWSIQETSQTERVSAEWHRRGFNAHPTHIAAGVSWR